MAKTMLGFDIGACELKIAQYDGSTVRRALTAQVPDNLVKNGVIISYAAMADFIKETAKANRVSGRDCAVILPASHACLRRVTVPTMTEDQLRAEFEAFGKVNSTRLVMNRFNGKSKGFGFVQMPNRDEAERACAAINEKEIMGRRVKCNEAKNLI